MGMRLSVMPHWTVCSSLSAAHSHDHHFLINTVVLWSSSLLILHCQPQVLGRMKRRLHGPRWAVVFGALGMGT